MIVVWTAELITNLRKWHSEGLSGTDIARLIPGASRNAVIGKLHRLGLNKDNGPFKPRKAPPRPKTRGEQLSINITKVKSALPFVEPISAPTATACVYDDLTPRLCHWPTHYDGPVQMYCAAPVDADKFRAVYCRYHQIKSTNRRADPVGQQIKPGKYTDRLGR